MTERDEQRGDTEAGVCHVRGEEFDSQLALSKHLMDVHEHDVLDPDPADRGRMVFSRQGKESR
jgi:hypothetical protein